MDETTEGINFKLTPRDFFFESSARIRAETHWRGEYRKEN
jgi:hypothetical protein